ncbi:MAG: glycosyltransferase, partial [Rhizobiaceae bacterium]
PGISHVRRLIAEFREFQPDVVQGWMYHGNLAAWLAKFFTRSNVHLFWNIRQTLYDEKLEKRLTRAVINITKYVANAPKKIVYNSKVSASQHEAIGYSSNLTVMIPNGFDLDRFKFSKPARTDVRSEFGIAEHEKLVVQISRFHPMKDQHSLLLAASELKQRGETIMFLLAGKDLSDNNPELCNLRDNLGLEGIVIFAGEREDIPGILSAGDVLLSSSAWGEAFPNVIGEAMATGVPCVVTDVGEAKDIVGKFGVVVPPKDPVAMADALLRILNLPKGKAGKLKVQVRAKIRENYSIEKIGREYLELYGVRQEPN